MRYADMTPHGHYCAPIVFNRQTLGVINLYVKAGHQRDPNEEEFLMAVANTLAGVIQRKLAEEKLQRNYDMQSVINAILTLSHQPISLHEQLEKTLELILSIPWLSIQKKGAIFLADKDSETLIIEAQRGFTDAHQALCASVPFGKCLCGRAALSQSPLFCNHIDDSHDIIYHDITPHGHYCIPIFYNQKTLGLLNLYVSEGLREDNMEKNFLMSIAHTLAGVIQHKLRELELYDSEERFKSLSEASFEGIAIIDNGVVVDANQQFADMFGYPFNKAPGLTILDLTAPEDKEKIMSDVLSSCESPHEIVFLKQNGAKLIAEVCGKSIPYKGKTVRVAALRDITERKKAIDKLRKCEVIASSSNEHMALIDAQFIYQSVNRIITTAHNKTYDQIVGHSVAELFGNNFFEKNIKSSLEQCLCGRTIHVQWWYCFPGIGQKFMDFFYYPFYGHEQEPIGAVLIGRDLTECRQMQEALLKREAALKESEESFRKIFEDSPLGMSLADLDYRFLQVNDMFCKMLGFSHDEMLRLAIVDITHPEDIEKELAMARQMAKEKLSHFKLEKRFIRKNNEIVWVNQTATAIGDSSNHKKYYLAMIEDITARRKAEEEIRILAKFPDELPGPVLRVTHDLTIRYANKIALTLLEPLNCQFNDYRNAYQLPHCWANDVEAVLQTSETRRFELQVGQTIYTVRITPITDSNVVYIYGYDITERKKMEQAISNSLKEKEILLREIHHRVKNNMQVISSLIGLQATYIKDKNTVEMFSQSQNRIKTMAIVHDKLYRSNSLATVDISDYASLLVDDLSRLFGVSDKQISLSVHAKSIFLGIDSAIPCGLIINELVSNALKHAFPDGRQGVVSIVIRSLNQESIEMIVSDNGVGLPPEVDYRDTSSLGLHIVMMLVRQLQGNIELDRTCGAAFKIRFKITN
jgi:PAS domain S-box-containing protein